MVYVQKRLPDWHVTPLCLGWIVRDASSFVCHHQPGKGLTAPLICWYVGGGGLNIMVDTGPCPVDAAPQFVHPFNQSPEENLPSALAALGLAAEDIDIVVNTHLHWDHCGGNVYFEQAEFYVHEKELEYADSPCPIHRAGYFVYDRTLKGNGIQFRSVERDVQLAPGVSLIHLPGHTPGTMGVLVESSRGAVLLASDALPLYTNFAETYGEHSFRPSGVYVCLQDYYKSWEKIEKFISRVDCVLPGHDSAVLASNRYL